MLKNEIYATQKSLNSWAKSEYPSKTIAQTFDTIELRHEPYGVALVMGAWNYPVNLLLCPVVGAIAAGVCIFTQYTPDLKYCIKTLKTVGVCV